jgi:hypothetical protein
MAAASRALLPRAPNAMTAITNTSWTPDAARVLARACEHHGGMEAYRSLHSIRLIPRRLSGFIPWLKGSGKTFPLPAAFEIFPHDQRVHFVDYPDADHTGIFENGAVRIERRGAGAPLVESKDHRRSFHGSAKNRRWTPLDALYFFGYALSHYHALPFSLSEGRLLRAWTVSRHSLLLDVLRIEMSENLTTHCREQTFYFEQSGRLIRHDYHAEIIGPLVRGAHFWNRQTLFDGFPVALERKVVARLGSTPVPFTALLATFESAHVIRRSEV